MIIGALRLQPQTSLIPSLRSGCKRVGENYFAGRKLMSNCGEYNRLTHRQLSQSSKSVGDFRNGIVIAIRAALPYKDSWLASTGGALEGEIVQ